MQEDIEELIKKAREKEIGDKVRIVRLAKKKYAKEVARALKISYQQYRKYENGINRISVSSLYEIAKFLNVDIIELLPESVKNNNQV